MDSRDVHAEAASTARLAVENERRLRAGDGSGLRGPADRVEALGGRLVVTSASGEGTIVRARLPLALADRAPRRDLAQAM